MLEGEYSGQKVPHLLKNHVAALIIFKNGFEMTNK